MVAAIARKWPQVGKLTVLIATVLIACRTGTEDHAAILLFSGRGTSPEDVAAIEEILDHEHLEYATIGSFWLNRMNQSQIQNHRLLIVPGGNFEAMGRGLTSTVSANIRGAVKDGLNYLGICAGAFLAGNSPYNGLNLTAGPRFGFYADEARGIRKRPVAITMAGGQTVDVYWEDGPQLSGWGDVVGKYPDGTPAIVEGSYGNGRVILTGVHPEAPENWRRGMEFRTSIETNHSYAASLIRAALDGERLPHDWHR